MLVEETARKIAGAVRVAHRDAVEARLKYGVTALTSIAQNRRDPAGPVDSRLDVLAADTLEGVNVATLARYACHATTLERDNLEITAEYPGEACRVIEQVIGVPGTGLFFNGACANINPAWIRQDYGDVHRLGSIVGGKAAVLSQELRPLGINHQAHNIRWEELTHRPVEAGRLVEGPLKAAARTFNVPYRSGPPDEDVARELDRLEGEFAAAKSRAAPEAERRAIAAKVTMARMERVALARTRDKGPYREEEVQAMRLGGGLYLVGLPGEVFFETGEEIRKRSGIDDLIVIAYANDYPGTSAGRRRSRRADTRRESRRSRRKRTGCWLKTRWRCSIRCAEPAREPLESRHESTCNERRCDDRDREFGRAGRTDGAAASREGVHEGPRR